MVAKNAKSKFKKAAAAKQSGSAKAASADSSDAMEMLKADHRAVEQLFAKYEASEDENEKQTLSKQICNELIIHATIEEEVFYPACRREIDDDDLMDEAEVEHDVAKVLIGELMSAAVEDEHYDAKMKVLSESIKHHVNEEEKKSDSIFAQAKKSGLDASELGKQMNEMKTRLKARAEASGLRPPQTRTFDRQKERFSSNREDFSMRQRMPERDDQGRFMSDDDDDRGGRSRSSRGRSDYDDDDDRDRRSTYGRGSSRSSRDYDDDRRGSSYRRSDRDYSDDRGQGGWFGDFEGHSEAARRGWENREDERSSRGRDDRGYSSRRRGSSYDNDNRSGGGGRSSSRYDYDDRRYQSRQSRSDNDYSEDRGQGGWFGDSEGHSEASRRGWENRR